MCVSQNNDGEQKFVPVSECVCYIIMIHSRSVCVCYRIMICKRGVCVCVFVLQKKYRAAGCVGTCALEKKCRAAGCVGMCVLWNGTEQKCVSVLQN